jgi:hypothetical protein
MVPIIQRAIHKFPQEAAIIGRLLVTYGEIEFAVAGTLGEVIEDRPRAFKAFFRLRSESSRLQMADALMRDAFSKQRMRGQYSDSLGAVRHCLKIRNQYAHCHWDDGGKDGLFFTNLQDSADSADGFDYRWRHVDVPLLESQEQYFSYAAFCLFYLMSEIPLRGGRLKSHPYSMPPKITQPKLHNPQEGHAPPWLKPNP